MLDYFHFCFIIKCDCKKQISRSRGYIMLLLIYERYMKGSISLMNRNDLCWCGSGRKYKRCHLAYDERIDSMKFDIFKSQVRPPKNIIKNEADIEGIRKSGVINDAALDLAGSMVAAGVDTASIDDAVRKFIEDHDAIPA